MKPSYAEKYFDIFPEAEGKCRKEEVEAKI
jgi:hypothetical protein